MAIIDFKALGQTTITGAAGTADAVFMNNGNNAFYSNGADTVIADVGGNDTVATNASSALVFGNTGSLLFANGAGNNSVIGGAGSLVAYGGTGAITAYGSTQSGVTAITGGTGTGNVLVGGAADSTVSGHGTGDLIVAGSGNASLLAFGANATLFGGGAIDTIDTSDSASTVVGGTGTLNAELGANSVLFVNGGRNQISVGFGQVTVPVVQHDVIVGYRAGTDQIINGSTQQTLTPVFNGGVYSTVLSNGVQLDVYAHV